MCLIAFAWRCAPGYRLVVASNRDEFHERPTRAADFWSDAPHILGGRDLRDGGSWMGLSASGRFAALTNHRNPAALRDAPRSRGHLVADYLRADQPAADYATLVAGQRRSYNGFNLLVGDLDALWYVGDQGDTPTPVAPGIHALSNARLDTPWPKATGLSAALDAELTGHSSEDRLVDGLLRELADTTQASDDALPDTGIDRERERQLSARRIVDMRYGTRSSTVLLLREDGRARLDELSYGSDGRPGQRVTRLWPRPAAFLAA